MEEDWSFLTGLVHTAAEGDRIPLWVHVKGSYLCSICYWFEGGFLCVRSKTKGDNGGPQEDAMKLYGEE